MCGVYLDSQLPPNRLWRISQFSHSIYVEALILVIVWVFLSSLEFGSFERNGNYRILLIFIIRLKVVAIEHAEFSVFSSSPVTTHVMYAHRWMMILYISTWEMHFHTNDSVTLFILGRVQWPHFEWSNRVRYRSWNWLRHKHHRKSSFRFNSHSWTCDTNVSSIPEHSLRFALLNLVSFEFLTKFAFAECWDLRNDINIVQGTRRWYIKFWLILVFMVWSPFW